MGAIRIATIHRVHPSCNFLQVFVLAKCVQCKKPLLITLTKMLDSDTKRRIDSARQILVGKVPDPKGQVEQITTALIYKLMDDMDKEAQELGGGVKFFTGEYEKYAWSRLMDVRLGGQARLNLYTEALETLWQNKNHPALFRQIFKGAF